MQKYEFKPIGFIRCSEKYKFEAPRQSVFAGRSGYVELLPEFGGDAIADLEGFERIWIIFCFHLNISSGWKSRVAPPFTPEKWQYSVFATRSPYRPNQIGMSCVRLCGLDGNKLLLENIDMLDGTPVLDIKPYIPEADAFPDAAAGWRDKLDIAQPEEWTLEFSDLFLEKNAFLSEMDVPDLVNFCRIQLKYNPLDRKRKRIYISGSGSAELGCRTWRILFSCDESYRTVRVLNVRSNYTADELADVEQDRYNDKEIHRRFVTEFSQREDGSSV